MDKKKTEEIKVVDAQSEIKPVTAANLFGDTPPIKKLSETEQKGETEKIRRQAVTELRRIADSMVALTIILFLIAYGSLCYFLGTGNYIVSGITGVFVPFLGRLLYIMLKEENRNLAGAVRKTVFGK